MLTAALAAGVAVAVVALDVAMFGHDRLDPSTQRPPSRPSVTGVWTLDRVGRAEVGPAVTPGSRPTLVLHDNGAFSARDLPDWWNPDALVIPDKTGYRRAWRRVSGSGRWALQKGAAGWGVTLRFSTPPRLSAELRLRGQNPPYRLGVILGDPDGGRSLTFEKTGAATAP